jgi:capsid assembly protease
MTIQPTISHLRMMASVRGQKWLIREDYLQEVALSMLEVRESLDIEFEDFYDPRTPLAMTDEGVAIIQIKGALINGGPAIFEKLGLCTRYSTIQGEIEAATNAGATAFLFNMNSPGGTVAGCIETARKIEAIEVPKWGFAEGVACSACYKLAAGMDVIAASPSAEVGNIGTILSWADCSEFWKEMGVEFKALTSEGADLKSTFHLEPDGKQIEFLQEGVNEAGEAFRGWVADHRPVDAEVFRAGWYSGDRAEQLGLIDGQSDLPSVLASLTLAARGGRSD